MRSNYHTCIPDPLTFQLIPKPWSFDNKPISTFREAHSHLSVPFPLTRPAGRHQRPKRQRNGGIAPSR